MKCIISAVQKLSETRQSQKQDNMVQLATEQRVFVVTNFIRVQNVREVQDAFGLRFPNRNIILLYETQSWAT